MRGNGRKSEQCCERVVFAMAHDDSPFKVKCSLESVGPKCRIPAYDLHGSCSVGSCPVNVKHLSLADQRIRSKCDNGSSVVDFTLCSTMFERMLLTPFSRVNRLSTDSDKSFRLAAKMFRM